MDRRQALWLLLGACSRADEPLRLASLSDRKTFVAWFTWLAEALYYLPEARRPAEVTDCSALLRFAYREALRPHTAQWAREIGLEWMPPLPELSRPWLQPAVFAAAPGLYRQFADAEHLMRDNAWLVSRSLDAARTGDLLFYRQLVDSEPWHSMIYLGRSAFEPGRETYAVYHTGPIGPHRGEIRRPQIAALLAHPEPRWRPVAGNGNFLGVFRWNILRGDD